MKKVDFRILSAIQCEHVENGQRCPKRLKQNLINRHPDAHECYTHWVLRLFPHLASKKLHKSFNQIN